MFAKEVCRLHKWEVEFAMKRPQGTPLVSSEPIRVNVSMFALQCERYGLESALQKCVRIVDRCTTLQGLQPLTYGETASLLKDLRERLEDDMEKQVFLHLTLEEAGRYKDPAKNWTTVIGQFPHTRRDIEDSSKCFALGMYAASVFHVLLVAEFGVIEVAKLLNVAGDKPGWGSLERLEKILDKNYKDRSPLEQKHSQLLQNVVPLSSAIKEAWRHKISHAENKLTWIDTDFEPRTANEIITATSGFMRRLAKDFPK